MTIKVEYTNFAKRKGIKVKPGVLSISGSRNNYVELELSTVVLKDTSQRTMSINLKLKDAELLIAVLRYDVAKAYSYLINHINIALYQVECGTYMTAFNSIDVNTFDEFKPKLSKAITAAINESNKSKKIELLNSLLLTVLQLCDFWEQVGKTETLEGAEAKLASYTRAHFINTSIIIKTYPGSKLPYRVFVNILS